MNLVSVCIPSYNAASTIEATIRSVLDSCYENVEIIINDDASTDDTKTIVEGIEDDRVKFYQNDHTLGVPANWNCAMQRANGRFVGLLNHDDLYGPFWLTFVINTLEKHDHIGWVASAYWFVNEYLQTKDVVSLFNRTGEIDRKELFLQMACLQGMLMGYIARREVFEHQLFYDLGSGPSADSDLYLRLAATHPLYYSNFPHTTYRMHSGNLTNKYSIVDEASHGFRILDNTFNAPNLSDDLRGYKTLCYETDRERVLARVNRLLELGYQLIAEQLMDILRQNTSIDS